MSENQSSIITWSIVSISIAVWTCVFALEEIKAALNILAGLK